MLFHRLAVCLMAAVCAHAPLRGGEPTVEFNRDIRPILSDKCFACHGPDARKRKGGLRLDEESSAKAVRDGRAAVVPGQAAKSSLVARITTSEADERMPPPELDKELSREEIALLTRWIDTGAAYQEHWAFVRPSRPSTPTVEARTWPRGEIDRFVLARIETAGLSPSEQADATTLVRRISFDLTGMPPQPGDVDSFASDPSDATYDRLVDRLLASRHFGERMAVHWLDLVRYADTVGYHGDQEHHISPYRDWVIKAFNDNMPFDRFTAEQLAGDLLPGATTDQRIASGYNRLLQTTHEGGAQAREYLAKYAADRVRNLGAVWMGATLGCAECHDHKYDPYTMRDFYSLAAFFADVQETGNFPGAGNTSPTRRPPEIEVRSPLDPDGPTRRTMVTVAVKPRTIRILNRGDWMDESGEIVSPAVPAFLPQPAIDGRRPTRLDLARWLTSSEQPQTPRIFVSRLWYLFFGHGLSRVLEDTGSQGEWPTHPKLLDWLAAEFIESGWDVQHMIRLIVQSRAYRQSSRVPPLLRERDPENRLYARQERFRLPAEMIRDQALVVSGLLAARVGGRSVRPYQPAGYYAHLNFPRRKYLPDDGDNLYRRSVYTHWQRQFLHPMLRAFDAPSREECTPRRPRSNTPLAALTLLNDPTFVEAARVFAARVLREGGATDEERVAWAWRQGLSRRPEAREVAVLRELLGATRSAYRDDEDAARRLIATGAAKAASDLDARDLAAWAAVARAILNLGEMITRS